MVSTLHPSEPQKRGDDDAKGTSKKFMLLFSHPNFCGLSCIHVPQTKIKNRLFCHQSGNGSTSGESIERKKEKNEKKMARRKCSNKI
jgi:hypothetical protein